MDDPLTVRGFLVFDSVAHGGHTLKGEFLRILTGTDPVNWWSILRTIRNNAYVHVHGVLEWILTHAPVPVAGIDFDNGSEFMNWGVTAGAYRHELPVARSRPNKHNDNAHVEQCNGDWVRRHAFRYRYQTNAETPILNELWDLVMSCKNHLLPCLKTICWTHTTAEQKKCVYDAPRTPYQRLIDAGVLDGKTHTRPERDHPKPNPARITRRINQIQQQLIDRTSPRTRCTRPAA